MPDLLPCPFCGDPPESDDGESGGTVECCNRHCEVQPSIFRDHEAMCDGLSLAVDAWNRQPRLTEAQWVEILIGLSLGDCNDRPRFVAYDESYGLSRHDCKKMAQQLVRHFALRQASNPKADPAAGVGGSASSALLGADGRSEGRP